MKQHLLDIVCVPLIPVRVNNALMPIVNSLPRKLKELSDWQGLVIRHDPDFRRDVNKLIEGIDELLQALGSVDSALITTAAEWKYACRAGITTRYFFGDSIAMNQANFYHSAEASSGLQGSVALFRCCLALSFKAGELRSHPFPF